MNAAEILAAVEPTGLAYIAALEAAGFKRRRVNPYGPANGRLVAGSMQHPDKPRVYADGDTLTMVAGTADPLSVPFQTRWALAAERTGATS